ncbi:ferritin-like domain-containing protein [Haloimpatiens lingqiaonensis]|uniref:ferritin-like domain-containing protein n=1 Tax=Haloimpatiens lingqiaonensis TaxID=1380675 RepID=UPI0010FE0725|nr:ferritin family protein [Haloimpatiens lingqiaonensis]
MLKCTVCGMIINEKNYNLNNRGIPEENSLENIKYCPFCGVPIEYIGSMEDAVIEVDGHNLNDDTKKILDHAMKLEIFNSEFYDAAALLVDNMEIKKMFLHLAKIEMVHARIHQKMGGFNQLPKLTKLDYKKYKGEGGDKDLLRLARKREIHAVEYYDKYSKSVEDENIVKIFKALSEVENDHVEMEEEAL